MVPSRLSQIGRLSRDEIFWRGTVFARTAAQRVAFSLHRPVWTRRHLERSLAPHVLDHAMRSALRREDWQTINAALTNLLLTRSSRFTLDPFSASTIRAQVLKRWPNATIDAASRADRILAGQYDLLGYRGLIYGSDDGNLDWHRDPVHDGRAAQRFWASVPYLDPAIGDHKIIWELNRHQHFLKLGRALWLTGDSRYGAATIAQVTSWLHDNPPLVGINWASMLEIALRSISWTWALHFLLADVGHLEHEDDGHKDHEDVSHKGHKEHKGLNLSELRVLRGQTSSCSSGPWVADMLLGLHRQLSHVEQNLSYYFSPNTHLTGEALALYVVGSALPELAASAQWIETGRRVLLTEIERQIAPDGGHLERSTHYQRYTLDFYLLALQIAVRTQDIDAIARFKDAVSRLAEFTRTIADDNGRLPLIGDDDGGMLWPLAGRDCDDVRDSLALAAVMLGRPDLAPWGVPEEVVWLAGADGVSIASLDCSARPEGVNSSKVQRGRLSSRVHADTGYWVGRDGRGGHLVFDIGAHGYLNGGHAHADALAITLSLKGRRVLIDPGTSTYTVDRQLRDRLRSSMSHNTVTIDGRTQSIPAGLFHWRTQTHSQLHAWRGNKAFDWVEASHNGYAPVRHRRSIIRVADDGWLVVDEILGAGPRLASTYWHFDPDWMISAVTKDCLRATHLDGDVIWLTHESGDLQLVHGDENLGLGWCAPVYGTLVPTWTARLERRAFAPFSMMTWIGTGGNAMPAPCVERLRVDSDSDDAPAIAASVSIGPRTFVVMLRPGADSPRAATSAGYLTNARVFHHVTVAQRLCALDLVEATYALALRDGSLSVVAEDRITDLHVSFEQDRLDLCASRPPSVLRLQGETVTRGRVIRLNGREAPPSSFERANTATLVASQWGDGDKWKSREVESGKVSDTVQSGTVSIARPGIEQENQWVASLGSQI